MRFPPFLILLLTTTLLFAQEEQKPFSLILLQSTHEGLLWHTTEKRMVLASGSAVISIQIGVLPLFIKIK